MKPTPDQGGSWGILGGTFDPVHRGHLKLASDIKEAKSLDGVLFVPSFRPPHKSQTAQAEMLQALKFYQPARVVLMLMEC